MAKKHLAIIAGVGTGTGSSIARRFAQQYDIVLLARKPESYQEAEKAINQNGGKAVGISTDVSNKDSVQKAFQKIAEDFPDSHCAVAVFNASGPFVRKSLLELAEEEIDAGYGVTVKGALLFAQSAIPLLLQHHAAHPDATPPSLFFTGSTAAVKANPRSAAMCVPRHGLRALALSAAKEFAPQGVHVVHTVVDGVIDIPRSQHFLKDMAAEAKIDPDAIAETYWDLHLQSRRCFTNEIDIRPMMEKW